MSPGADIPVWKEAPPAGEAEEARLYAMYSSVWGGIVTDPRWMTVPVNDHLVHRGDGVFETIKCVKGFLYQYEAHLDRLERSAASISLANHPDRAQITRAVKATVRAGDHPDCLVRILLSRGPGGMGIDPRECPTPGLYIIVYPCPPPFMERHPGGASIAFSPIPAKAGMLASVKSCNYLPNALMKLDAARSGVDFTFGLDEQGHLSEGPTENLGVVNGKGLLLIPEPGRILDGTTMLRVYELADRLIRDDLLTGKQRTGITLEEVNRASEILIFGTTTDVTAVVEINHKPVGDGTPGPVFQALSCLLRDEQYEPPTAHHTDTGFTAPQSARVVADPTTGSANLPGQGR
ncbi:MAG: aminotransferase class IV [Kiritimatiellae bacterium]|nr:aminotransferase class IV [Kiritimatiellia bacterium]